MIEISEILSLEEHLDGIDTVIFDLDDTLYSEIDYVRSGYTAVAHSLPQIDGMAEKLWKAFQEKKNAIDVVLREAEIYTEELKTHCLNTYRHHMPNISLYKGVADMLIRIKQSGKNIGIITDGRPEGQWAKIKALGLENKVDKIIVTDELGGTQFRKPCDKAFVLMQEHFGDEFTRMLYIGDNPQKDFIAPKKLGMRVVYFKNMQGLYSV